MHLCVDSVRDGRSCTSRRVRLCRELRHEEVSFYLYLLLSATRPTATRLAVTRLSATRHTATRLAAKRSAAIRPAAKRSCLSHSRPTSLILHDTLHWPRTSSFQLPWEGRGVSDVMLNSFGFISLGTSPFTSHRSSGLLCASSLHSCSDTPCGDTPCGDTPCGDTPCGDTPCGDTPCGDTPCSHKSLSLAFEAVIQPTFNQHNLRPRYPRHGQSIQRSSDPAIKKRTLHCAHKLIDDLEQLKDPSNGGTRQRALGNTRVATPGSEHGRCIKQGRRPENRARNMTRKALLLLALSFGLPFAVFCVLCR